MPLYQQGIVMTVPLVVTELAKSLRRIFRSALLHHKIGAEGRNRTVFSGLQDQHITTYVSSAKLTNHPHSNRHQNLLFSNLHSKSFLQVCSILRESRLLKYQHCKTCIYNGRHTILYVPTNLIPQRNAYNYGNKNHSYKHSNLSVIQTSPRGGVTI